MSQERSKRACPSGDGGIPTIRNRYFTGKYMTARDFADEQYYMLSRQRLHNRLFHGWGIVCGLHVNEHGTEECRPGWIVVKAGVAIDCYGREIFLPKDTGVEVPLDQLPSPAAEEPVAEEEALEKGEYASKVAMEKPVRGEASEGEESDEEPIEGWPQDGLLVCLRYCEEEVEPVPALYAENGCDPTHQEANRVREVWDIEFHRLSDLPDC
jgi:hypothetical protein